MKSEILKSTLTVIATLFILVSPLKGAEIFTGKFKDYKVDLDGDGKADELNIDIELNVPKEDNKYVIRGFLGKQCYSEYNLNFKEGKSIITLHFDGYSIFKDKMNGPYVLERLYFGRYLSSMPNDTYEELDYRKLVRIETPYKYKEFEQPDLSFRGKEATFDLKLGQKVKIVEANIGGIEEIKLLSITIDNVDIFVSNGPHRYNEQYKLALGQDIVFNTGGEEQVGILQLLEIRNDTARFKIRFVSSPPALEISDDMPIDIIYRK